jgi:GH25 family lysozyme M1 (1,4-beta-N-acetylmuramidase)
MDISAMAWGPDVSHWHPVRNWDAFAASGATFFAAKATESAHTVDVQFERHRDGFRDHCPTFAMAVWYHMFHAEKDPVTQAEHFSDVVGPLAPRERLCCDFEGVSYRNVEAEVMRMHGLQYLEVFYARLESLGVLSGTRPLIYTSDQHWQAIGDPSWPRAAGIDLWVPRYAPDPKPPEKQPSPWSDWQVLQYTDGNAGVHRDVPGIGLCDCNVLADQRSEAETPGDA